MPKARQNILSERSVQQHKMAKERYQFYRRKLRKFYETLLVEQAIEQQMERKQFSVGWEGI